MSRLRIAALLLAAPSAGFAQSTADQIRRAVDMYNNFNIEGARPILAAIISPSYLQRVEPHERVTAYKYLGASYAVLDKPDSAATFFQAALDFDPFTDLDPREFSAAELNAFNTAKQRLFKVALRPISPRIVDSTYAFRLISTHRSSITVDLIDQRDTLRKEVLYQGENDGPRELRWNGLLRSGQRADSTIYELRVIGRSLLATMAGSTTTDRQLFRIEHVYEPLEDTLPTIPANELLQEQNRPAAPWLDLIKGSVVGIAAVTLPLVALDKDVQYQPHAIAAGAVGLGSAVVAFLYRRANRTIHANVQENTRRQTARANFNAGVRRRNENRINATTLLICPPTGCPR